VKAKSLSLFHEASASLALRNWERNVVREVEKVHREADAAGGVGEARGGCREVRDCLTGTILIFVLRQCQSARSRFDVLPPVNWVPPD
ncbi:hypothetical protein GWI33_003741, partial [Rhynchophorus ferrugineus]